MIHTAILDRALEVSWLDLALRFGREGAPDARARLELELRDRLPASEARKKTVRTLWRTWLEPPEPARDMIAWARTRSSEIGDSRPLHIGALIATHPFFADICAAIGREAAQSEVIRVTDLRQRLRERWAARQSVDVAARAAVRTFRSFGILRPLEHGLAAEVVTRLEVPELLGGWLAHALLLARAVTEIESDAVRVAPEFFMLAMPRSSPAGYDGVASVLEGGRRAVIHAVPQRAQEIVQSPEQLLLVEPTRANQPARRLRRAL